MEIRVRQMAERERTLNVPVVPECGLISIVRGMEEGDDISRVLH